MNFKKFHESRNLFDKADTSQFYTSTSLALAGWWQYSSGSVSVVIRIPCKINTTYTLACDVTTSVWRISLSNTNSTPTDVAAVTVNDIVRDKPLDGVYSFTTASDTKYILFQIGSSVFNNAIDNIMLNEGSTALPYEPYSSEVWHDIPHYIMGTDTDTITTPAVIYANDASVTVEITGNTGGVGDLVESGEHAGEYVIPIINNGVTTNIYNATALDISDSLTTTIPTTDGANTLSVDTTVQPSEVTVNYKGWHPVQSVHERENGAWT